MKKIQWIGMAAAALVAAGARADTNALTAITNYLPNYKMVSTVCTNAGNTGLATGTTYYCFAGTDVAQMTETAGTNTAGSFSQLVYGMCKALYDGYYRVVASNRVTKVRLAQTTLSDDTNNLMKVFATQVDLAVTQRLDVVTE